MSNGTFNQCSGTFTDSGGTGNPYGNNEDFILTICPDVAGNKVSVDFQSFSTEQDVDILIIYNGTSTDFADIIDSYTGSDDPGYITSTSADGCLTFNFISDTSIVDGGWFANVGCFVPCQTINSRLDSATPAPNAQGNIKVCVGENINLLGSGIFSNSGAGATYQWDLGDGRTIDGQNATFNYDTPGVYLVNLDIRDTNTSSNPDGCPNTNILNQVVQVSTEPDFTGTEAEDLEICLGNSTNLFGNVEGVYFQAECTPPVSETTPLPDGVGISYQTSITVDCFDSSQTLLDASELVEVCITIEHSWADDLDIALISPDGRKILLFERQSINIVGGVYLGGANDLDDVDPPVDQIVGEGREYCFRMDAATLLQDAPLVQDGVPLWNSLEPGNYLPVESFDGLVGSPLNGLWTLEIIDNIFRDNGVIFEWNLDFDPSLLPAEFSFTPNIVSEGWDSDSSIENTNGNSISVRPTSVGQHCYTYRVLDDFGCEYTEDVCIDVFPAVVAGNPIDFRICDNLDAIDGIGTFDLSTKDVEILSGQNPADFQVTYYQSFNDADRGINPLPTIYNNTSNPQTIYSRTELITSNALCYEIVDFELIVDLLPEFTLPQDVNVCTDTNGTEEVQDPILDTGLSELEYTFQWSLDGNILPAETSSSIIASTSGIYTVLVTDINNGCTNSADTNVFDSGPPELTARTTSEPFADRNTIEATATGFGDYEFSLNGGPFQSSGRFDNAPSGVNIITARDINGCGSASVTLTIINFPKFFSPNGDGNNDTWRVNGLGPGSTAVIYIFDRYGKLLKQISPNGQGWDGKFNGYPMPSTDYWFSIDFDDPDNGSRRNFSSHFSLVR